MVERSRVIRGEARTTGQAINKHPPQRGGGTVRHGFPRRLRGASAMHRDPVVPARRLAPPPANVLRPSGTPGDCEMPSRYETRFLLGSFLWSVPNPVLKRYGFKCPGIDNHPNLFVWMARVIAVDNSLI